MVGGLYCTFIVYSIHPSIGYGYTYGYTYVGGMWDVGTSPGQWHVCLSVCLWTREHVCAWVCDRRHFRISC